MRQLDRASHRHQMRGPNAMIKGTTGGQAVRAGLVGAGQRAAPYFRNVPNDMAGSVRLAAIAHPDPAPRQALAEPRVGSSAPLGELSGRLAPRPGLLDDRPAMPPEPVLDAGGG